MSEITHKDLFGKPGPMEIGDVEFFKHETATGLHIEWGKGGVGFGSIAIIIRGDGEMHIDTERMSRDFIKEVFSALIDKLPTDLELEKLE